MEVCCLSRSQWARCKQKCSDISRMIWAEIGSGVTQPFASYGTPRSAVTVTDTLCVHDRNKSTHCVEE